MQSKIQRWGNSLAVRIPKVFAQDIGLQEDASVEISMSGRDLVISPAKPPSFTLERLLRGITDENLHEEVETGPALGQARQAELLARLPAEITDEISQKLVVLLEG